MVLFLILLGAQKRWKEWENGYKSLDTVTVERFWNESLELLLDRNFMVPENS